MERRARNLPISGPMLTTKAREIAVSIGNESFKASNGWLESFQRRHNLSFRALAGESAGMDMGVVENWKENIDFVLWDYALKDVFNLNATGLFWRALPNKTLAAKSNKAKGGKLAKERLTACFLCSATGEKMKPLVMLWITLLQSKT